jgi:hypothetical protein
MPHLNWRLAVCCVLIGLAAALAWFYTLLIVIKTVLPIALGIGIVVCWLWLRLRRRRLHRS